MKNFTIIPNELLEESQLSIQERYLHCVLLKYCGQKDTCFPSQATLAKVLNRDSRQVRNILAGLISNGLVRKTRRGWNRSNTYEVAKKFIRDRKLNSYHLGNMFPFHKGNQLPPKNTYLTGKGKRSKKGLEKLGDILYNKILPDKKYTDSK